MIQTRWVKKDVTTNQTPSCRLTIKTSCKTLQIHACTKMLLDTVMQVALYLVT